MKNKDKNYIWTSQKPCKQEKSGVKYLKYCGGHSPTCFTLRSYSLKVKEKYFLKTHKK